MAAKLEGEKAPDFTLTDTDGKAVHWSDYRGIKKIVLVFNRALL